MLAVKNKWKSLLFVSDRLNSDKGICLEALTLLIVESILIEKDILIDLIMNFLVNKSANN